MPDPGARVKGGPGRNRGLPDDRARPRAVTSHARTRRRGGPPDDRGEPRAAGGARAADPGASRPSVEPSAIRRQASARSCRARRGLLGRGLVDARGSARSAASAAAAAASRASCTTQSFTFTTCSRVEVDRDLVLAELADGLEADLPRVEGEAVALERLDDLARPDGAVEVTVLAGAGLDRHRDAREHLGELGARARPPRPGGWPRRSLSLLDAPQRVGRDEGRVALAGGGSCGRSRSSRGRSRPRHPRRRCCVEAEPSSAMRSSPYLPAHVGQQRQEAGTLHGQPHLALEVGHACRSACARTACPARSPSSGAWARPCSRRRDPCPREAALVAALAGLLQELLQRLAAAVVRRALAIGLPPAPASPPCRRRSVDFASSRPPWSRLATRGLAGSGSRSGRTGVVSPARLRSALTAGAPRSRAPSPCRPSGRTPLRGRARSPRSPRTLATSPQPESDDLPALLGHLLALLRALLDVLVDRLVERDGEVAQDHLVQARRPGRSRRSPTWARGSRRGSTSHAGGP